MAESVVLTGFKDNGDNGELIVLVVHTQPCGLMSESYHEKCLQNHQPSFLSLTPEFQAVLLQILCKFQKN